MPFLWDMMSFNVFEFRLASTESVVCLLRWVERHMAGREQKPSPDTTTV